MSMRIGHADFIRLFRVDDPKEWVPSLVVHEDGVYISSPDSPLISAEERATLTEHPTGDLTQPALQFPCGRDELKAFVDFFGLHGYVDAFDLLDLVERKAFEEAQVEMSNSQGYAWPIVVRIGAIRQGLARSIEVEKKKSQPNDSKIVVMRDVLEQMNAALPDPDRLQDVSGSSSSVGPWPWGPYETKLLRDLAEAVRRFWVNYDPADYSTAETNETVAAWLMAKPPGGCGMSANVAKAMASILRADGLPTGPRAK